MSDLGHTIKKVELAEERLKTHGSANDEKDGGFALKKSGTLKGDLQLMNDRSESIATGVE